ncbi:MAG: hypothetical protein H6628_05590 [Calditrichae bacterium]|nr:hypothetical protein [Calditrichia bacterium]
MPNPIICSVNVYLTVPLEQNGGANCQFDESRERSEYRFMLKNAPLYQDRQPGRDSWPGRIGSAVGIQQ